MPYRSPYSPYGRERFRITLPSFSLLQRQPMRDGEGFRVFDRENWQRKVRTPAWFQRAESEKRTAPTADPKAGKEW